LLSTQHHPESAPAERAFRLWHKSRPAVAPGRKRMAALGAMGLFLGIAGLDFLGGPEIHLFVFYLLPVLYVTSQFGQRAGMISCVLGVASASFVAWVGDGTAGINEWVTAAARLMVSLTVVAGWGRLHDMGMALAELSMVDPLTGLHNRRACYWHGEAELVRMRRTAECLSLMFIDLDNFKAVNDSHGHKAGDQLLRATAMELRRLIRESDVAARVGGDEFAVILPRTDGEGGRNLAQAVHANLQSLFQSLNVQTSASIGVATFRRAPASFEAVLHGADELMYEIKASGKDGVRQQNVSAPQDTAKS